MFSLASSVVYICGEAAELKTVSNILSIGEQLKDLEITFTADDLNTLKSGVFTTDQGSTLVNQYLSFNDTTASVIYAENDNNEVGDFLKFEDGSALFTYHLEFTEGAESEIGPDGSLDDLENHNLFILGHDFTVFDAYRFSGNGISLTLLGGAIGDSLLEGDTKLYYIDGTFYSVTLIAVNETSQSVNFSINGVAINGVEMGELVTFDVNRTLAVMTILANQRDKLVEFYLDADKIELDDSDYANSDYAEETVKVNGNVVNNAQLIIMAMNGSSDTKLKLLYIKYKPQADDDYYVPEDKGLKEFFSQDEAFLTDTWDIIYPGLVHTGTSTMRLIPTPNHSYNLSFENINSDNYTFPFVTNKSDSDLGFKYGDSSRNLIFTEPFTPYQTEDYYNKTFVSMNDYFIISNATVSNSRTVTNVLKYYTINIDDKTVQFTDLSQGNLIVSYTGIPGINASGEFIVSGASHNFWVGNETRNYSLSIDLNADGNLAEEKVNPVIKGGGILDLGAQSFDSQTGQPLQIEYPITLTLTTPADYFDEPDADETIINTIFGNGANSLSLTVDKTLVVDTNDSNYSRTLTAYGVLIEKYTPPDNQTSPSLIIYYPLMQRSAYVFLTASSRCNEAPTITIISNVTVNETALINITSYFNVSYDISSPLLFSFYSPLNASGKWQTTFNDSGEYDPTIRVSDGQLSSSKTIHITILDLSDIDGDGNPDYNDTDDDNDGINDTVDRVLGNASYVNSDTLSAINVTVNGSDNLSKLFNSTFNVTLGNRSMILVEFSYNFTESILPLYNISIDVQNGTVAGSLLIRGLVLQGDFTKTVYVDRISSSINSVCIKDAPINDIDEISSLCNGANETPLVCPSLSSIYNCSLANNNQSYKITGLRYSGVRQQTYCGDDTCDGGETCSSCQSDCGACPSGHSSGGGGIIDTEKDWICLNWSMCLNDKQTQNCTHRIQHINKTNVRACNVTLSTQNTSVLNDTNTSTSVEHITENFFNNQANQSYNETFKKEESLKGKNLSRIKSYMLIIGSIFLISIISALLFFRLKGKHIKSL
jgi:hypothetical protein